MANAEFVVDVHASMNFLAAVAVGFEAIARFEQFDLIGVSLRLAGSRSLRAGFLNGLLWSLLGLSEGNQNAGKKTNYCGCAEKWIEGEMKSQDGLGGSLGRGRRWVKRWMLARCRKCTACQICAGRKERKRVTPIRREAQRYAEKKVLGTLVLLGTGDRTPRSISY